MQNTKHTAALAKLQEALGKIYHNATLPRLCDLEDVEGGLELKSLLDKGHNPRGGRQAPSEAFTMAAYDVWLGAAVEQAAEDLAAVADAGKVYQWGRGGRTLAPINWVNQRGGSSFSIKTAEDLAAAFDGGAVDTCPEQAAEYLASIERLTGEVEAFNAAQTAHLAALPAWWREELTYRVGEKLAEVTLEHQQAQAAKAAAALYGQYCTGAGQAALNHAAHAWAYANGHPSALRWEDILALAPVEAQPTAQPNA